MKISTSNKLLFTGLFLYASAFLINYLVRSIPSLHFAKDGGMANVALFHCIASYLYFILLQRSFITFGGIGFFVGLATCLFDLYLQRFITWNPPDYFNFILLNQVIADTIVLITGVCYLTISNKLQ